MPSSKAKDRERSRQRRRDSPQYNQSQKAARQKRSSARRQRAPIKNQPTAWWLSFHRSMRRTRWKPAQWSRTCETCHAILLDGESTTFCCNKGKWTVPPLPPLPPNVSHIIEHSTAANHLSFRSRTLNNLFAFTAIGATEHFQHFQNGPASITITGRTYHRLFDIADNSHSLHWFLYDSAERDRQGESYNVPIDWVHQLETDLNAENPYISQLRRFNTLPDTSTCALQLSDVASNGDFAAILHAENSTTINPRSIVIWRNRDAAPTFISIYSRHYEPLQYPLLFPHGTPGWGLTETEDGRRTNALPLTLREWCRSRILTDDRFLTFGRLTCEYLCDMYSRIEEERLNFISKSKAILAQNHAGHDEIDESENIDLPSSFLGSRKWASEQTADSLALAHTYGPPSFFITMTCNPDWPEIQSRLRPGQHAYDAPIVVARAFKNRFERLQDILRTKMGRLTYITVSNEFQKRGYPHSHIVLQVAVLSFSSHFSLLISSR